MAYLPIAEQPLVYVLGPDSMLFDFRGTYSLIDNGDAPVKLTKHIRQVNCLLTPAPSRNSISNALFQNQARVTPIIGSVHGRDVGQRLEEHGVPAIVAKQSDKYEPVVLFKSLAEGRLELIVLDGGQKPYLDALQKALEKGDNAAFEAAAEKFGLIFALIWYPAKVNDKVHRILYTGSASSDRIILALEKASSLNILQTPSATTGQANAGIAPPSKTTKVSVTRPNGGPAAKPIAPTSRPAPTRHATSSAAAPAKPPTTRAPVREVPKPAVARPIATTTVRSARPSATTATSTAVRSARTSVATKPAPAPKAAEPMAIKKITAPVRGTASSGTTLARKPEPKKDSKTATPSKTAGKEAPKETPEPAEHVPAVVVPSVVEPSSPSVDALHEEPTPPGDFNQSSVVPVVSEPGRDELAPEVRVIPATPEPPHLDDEARTPEPFSEHHEVPLTPVADPISVPAEPEPAMEIPRESDEPAAPQQLDEDGLLDNVEAPMMLRKISMDTDKHNETADPLATTLDKTVLDSDDLLSGMCIAPNQLIDAAIAASLSQTVVGAHVSQEDNGHQEEQIADPHVNGDHAVSDGIDKMKAMQTRSSVVESSGDDHKVYEKPDEALDEVLASVTNLSEREDQRLSQDHEGFEPVDVKELPPQPMHMVLTKIKPQLKHDRYFELVTVPHKGSKCTLENLDEARDFFRSVRSSAYILASEDIQPFVLEGWLEGKRAWQKPNAHCSLYPTAAAPAIQAFSSAHRDDFDKEHMTIHASISHSSILIQTEEGPEEFKAVKVLL